MSLNPWSELREAHKVIDRLKRDVEFLSRTMDRKDSYLRDVEERLIKYEKRSDEQSAEIVAMSHHLSNVWRVMQEWKPARVVKMYEEDK